MEAREKLPLEASPTVIAQRRSGGNERRGPADDERTEAGEPGERELLDPRRWGLPGEAIAALGERLVEFRQRFRACFTTCTRDPSANAYTYLRGQLTMDSERNFANIARHMLGGDGQALQHFMSNSPWSGPAVFRQIQAEIKATAALAQGSTLLLEESADEKAGTHNAGAARQYNGRLGQGDVCRVDTCLTYANGGVGEGGWRAVLARGVVWEGAGRDPPRAGHPTGPHVRDEARAGLADAQAGEGQWRAV